MANAAKEKVPVDHSAISGAKKEGGAPPGEAKASDVLGAMKRLVEPLSSIQTGPTPTPAPAQAAKPAGILGTIKRGREMSPPRILLVGTEGIGKSTFAANAPGAIFIPTEDGLGQIDCASFPVAKTYGDVVTPLRAIASEAHEFNTVAIDSVDWLERLIWANVCARSGKRNIEDIGYAKGYTFALDEWAEVVGLLDKCHKRGMAVILIAHAKIEKFEDPENPTYDRFAPRLHKHAQAFLTEWADAVLFATRKTAIKKDGEAKDARSMAVGVGAAGGERILRTTGSPACVAKNRYNLAPEIPLDWKAFEAGVNAFMASPVSA